jgi:hypothetical protein
MLLLELAFVALLNHVAKNMNEIEWNRTELLIYSEIFSPHASCVPS